MKLSIVVPVYNVKKYLKRCVDSLLDQGEFCDYEIILVDDGSTDCSGKICDEYSQLSNKIIVIHKNNGGLSSARNAGLEIAKGVYVLFVDSDDYIRSDCLTELIGLTEKQKTEIVSFNFSYVRDDYDISENKVFIDLKEEVITGDEWLLRSLKEQKVIMAAWKNLYKRSLIVENSLLFREGYFHEDEEWTPRVFHCARTVSTYPQSIYGYYIRNGSITNDVKKNRKAAIDLIDNCIRLKNYYRDIPDMELRSYLEDYTVTLILSAFYKGRLLDQSDVVFKAIKGCSLGRINEKKVALFHRNAKIYLKMNDLSKWFARQKRTVLGIKAFVIKCWNYSSQNGRKQLRKILICNNQRKRLMNHQFSIISSTCNGGVITSELGENFRTPTINIWFTAKDFLKLLENLEYYMGLEIKEVENNFCPYPVGRLGDIYVFFMHYHSFDQAVEKWEKRKKRINYDDLYIMMAERNGCTPEMVRRFNELPYDHKVIFTYNEYPEYKSAICVKEVCDSDEVGIMTDYCGLVQRKYDRYFNYVSWLNGDDENGRSR